MMIRVQRGRRAFIPALLVRVVGKNAIVKPLGHRRSESVPLHKVRPWKSRQQLHLKKRPDE